MFWWFQNLSAALLVILISAASALAKNEEDSKNFTQLIDGKIITFSSKPMHKEDGFLEYESLDRRYTLQTINSKSDAAVVIRDRLGKESVAEFLFRHHIIYLHTKDLVTISQNISNDEVINNSEFKKIWDFYLQIQNENPTEKISPFQIFVEYTSEEKNIIKNINYEKPPFPFQKRRTKVPESELELLAEYSEDISLALKSSYFPYSTKTFLEIQGEARNIQRYTEGGKLVRIEGVDEEYEKFLIQEIKTKADSLGYNLRQGFYFGSRVVPRTDLAKMDAEVARLTEMEKGALKKNLVRTGGLTISSDLEIMLVLSPKNGKISTENLEKVQENLMLEIRKNLNKKTRRFSFGMKLMLVDKDDVTENFFPKVRGYLRNTFGWVTSPHQNVLFYPAPRITAPDADCLAGYRALANQPIRKRPL